MLQQLVISKPKEESNYFFSGTITWRNVSFHVTTTIIQIQYGYTHQVVVLYNNKIFRFSLTKWKYSGGSSGESPIIISGDYHLQLKSVLNGVYFKEKVRDESFDSYDSFCNNFEISSAYGNYETNIQKPKKTLLMEVGAKETTLEKELYKYHDNKVDIESLAYFDSNRLVVDYWKLYDNYESEEFIYVSEDGTKKLKNHFYVSENSELLFKIKETCSGKESFELFEKLLNKLEILFTRVRR
ncbi:MAG: hypothetical protein RLY89_2810 [Bacteroidota bacterium]|jgi:hypothetical protein